jgi:hypothetical protein
MPARPVAWLRGLQLLTLRRARPSSLSPSLPSPSYCSRRSAPRAASAMRRMSGMRGAMTTPTALPAVERPPRHALSFGVRRFKGHRRARTRSMLSKVWLPDQGGRSGARNFVEGKPGSIHGAAQAGQAARTSSFVQVSDEIASRACADITRSTNTRAFGLRIHGRSHVPLANKPADA